MRGPATDTIPDHLSAWDRGVRTVQVVLARGTAQARLNNDRNEVEMIMLDGRIGRDDFSANINRRR
jgi:hypothetical protein